MELTRGENVPYYNSIRAQREVFLDPAESERRVAAWEVETLRREREEVQAAGRMLTFTAAWFLVVAGIVVQILGVIPWLGVALVVAGGALGAKLARSVKEQDR